MNISCTRKIYFAYSYCYSENEAKLGELLVYYSLILIFTYPFWKNTVFAFNIISISEAKRRDGVNSVSLRILLHWHGIAADVNVWSDCDVTILVATKHVRNNYSIYFCVLSIIPRIN